jgi:PGM1 C-terminal domain
MHSPPSPIYDFEQLQQFFAEDYEHIFNNDLAPKAVVVVPSLTLDQQILSKIKGHFYYEERMLCLLLLLKMPETHLTFVTSIPISPLIIDYYLHMLPGITSAHARKRLTLLSCYDASNVALTTKILNRPRLIDRIKNSIPHDVPTHLICFNVTEEEKLLATKLQVPIYGSHPELNYLGTKSGSKKLFKTCGLSTPSGYEDLHTEEEIAMALLNLKLANPELPKAVIKMNDGFSGDGNAIFTYDADYEQVTLDGIKNLLQSNTKFVAKKLKYAKFMAKFESMGGIVEEFVLGENIVSPSVQCRISPIGDICIISTHDQLLGGESGHVFLGANFPADTSYASEIAQMTCAVAEQMRDKGVIGRFGIDFMSYKNADGWQHIAIEINLRKGGTTHPFLMLQFLTDGHYDAKEGAYFLRDGSRRYYFATDNLQNDNYKGLTPSDLIDIAMYHSLHFDHYRGEGVMFHLISALSQFGKLGMVCIAKTPEKAVEYYQNVIAVLDQETATKE